jgi:hypothetical protein
MKKYVSFLLVVLCCTVIHAGPASAAGAGKVYLKDGAVIDCQKMWRSGSTIMVRVNRDVLLEFPSAEVDLKKTFAPKTAKGAGKNKRHKASKRKTAGSVGAVPVQKPLAPAVKPAVPAKPAAKVGIPVPPAKGASTPGTVSQGQGGPGGVAGKVSAPPVPVAAARQAAPSSAKVAAAAPPAPKPVPRPAVKYVPPPPPPPEPFYKNPLVQQAGGGGLLVVLLLVLLVMRKKKA